MIAADCTRRRRERGTIRCPAMPAARAGPEPRSIRKPACFMSGRYRLPIARHHPQAGAVAGHLRLHRPSAVSAGTARTAAAQAAVRQHRRHRHELRRASLAHSSRPQRGDAVDPASSASASNLGLPIAQLGAGDQDGHDRRADGIFQRAALRAGAQSADPRPQQSSIRICGSTTRPAAKCWRRSSCRPTRPARR